MFLPMRLLFLAYPQAVHSAGLEYAGHLALTLGVPLHLTAFIDPHGAELASQTGAESPDMARERVMAQRHQWLKSESMRLQAKGVEVHPDVICSSAVECAAYAQRVEADLIIKDMQARPGLSALDWELLSASPVSVLFVRPGPIQTCGKFLVAVDMAFQSKAEDNGNHSIIEAARHLANACGAALHLISVYDSGASDHGDLSLYEARKRAFDALASQHGIASEHRHFIPGAPANAIRFYLQRSAYDLLVIGAANHHLLASDIGLTAEGILEGAGCSVLAIKLPAGAQSAKAVEEARQLEPDLIRN